MKLITLFSGVGMQEMGILSTSDYQLINYCEYDKNIAKCFCLLHPSTTPEQNLGDITKLDVNKYYTELKKEKNDDVDMIISSFPCQSFSIAGKKKGFADETRGNLYDCAHKLIMKVKPKIVIYENVKNITNVKFGAVQKILDSMVGYHCFHKILNAKNYGIPQNRERWFMVCVRDDVYLEKNFVFPKELPLTTTVKDYVDITKIDRPCEKSMVKFFDKKYVKEYKSHSGLKKVFDGVGDGHFKSGFTTHRIYSIHGNTPTFTTSNDTHFFELKGKLLPLERVKLMGMTVDDYKVLSENGISNSLINKICGNGIVVDVFREVFREVYKQYLI